MANGKQFGGGSNLLGDDLMKRSNKLEEKLEKRKKRFMHLVRQNFAIKNFKLRNQHWLLNESA